MDRRRFLQSATVLVASTAAACASRSSISNPVVSRELAFAFDAQGNRYEMDILGNTVRRVDSQGNLVWSLGTAADSKLFNGPTSLVVDPQGIVYVADTGNGEIEKISATGAPIGTFAKELLFAHDLALDSRNGVIYVSDGPSHRIRAYDLAGRAVRSFGRFGTDAQGLNFPRGLAISNADELHVVDSGNARIQVYGLDGTFRRSYGGTAGSAAALRSPRDIAFNEAGESIVTDPVGKRLAYFDAHGAFVRDRQVDSGGKAASPRYIAIAPDGRLYVTVI